MKQTYSNKTILCLLLLCVCFVVACSSVSGVAESIGNAVTASNVENERAARQNVAHMICLLFDEAADIDDMRVENTSVRWYAVYVDSPETTNYAYAAYVDRESGTVLHVKKSDELLPLTDEQRIEAAQYDYYGEKNIVDTTALDWACSALARSLVENTVANGRKVLETQLSFTLSDNVMEPAMEVGINVHMDKGASYTVTYRWPQMALEQFSIYPLGWEACVYGYYDSSEADGRKPLGERLYPRSDQPLEFDGVSYVRQQIVSNHYWITAIYRYDFNADDMAGLNDCRLGEAEAWAKAENALFALVPEYQNAPERFTVDACAHGEGTINDYPTWRFTLSDRTSSGIRRGNIKLYLDRYGNVAWIDVYTRSIFSDTEVEAKSAFSDQKIVEKSMQYLAEQGYSIQSGDYEITVELAEANENAQSPSVEWIVTVTDVNHGETFPWLKVYGDAWTGRVKYYRDYDAS